MKNRNVICLSIILLFTTTVFAQRVKTEAVPTGVRSALTKMYPSASGVTWEKEKGNYEANWGGKSKEDNSVVFTPGGVFVEKVEAMPVSALPAAVANYVKNHYAGASITEAGKVTDAQGKISYEAEVKGKDLVFDENGNFLKID